MMLLFLAVLPFASQALECYTGTIMMGGQELTKDDLMKKIGPLLGASMVSTIDENPKLKAFMDTRGQCQVRKGKCVGNAMPEKAKECQGPCLETVPLSMKTLFLTDQQDDQIGSEAITGAMHACFPGIPSGEIESMVKQTVEVLQHAQEVATTRLYTTNMMKLASSYSFFPLCGLVVAMSLMLFSAGVAVGRRWKRSPYREVEEGQQETLIVAAE
jgi:hypothetical protein